MKQQIQDERILTQRRKTDTETLQLLEICLGAAIIIQFFFLHAPVAQIAAESVCLLGAIVYSVVRNAMAGAGADAQPNGVQSTKQLVINALVSGALTAFLFLILAGDGRVFVLAGVFIGMSALSLGAGITMRAITRRRLSQMDAALSEDEDA